MSLHQKALDKAKIKLMIKPDAVFFASVCLSLKHHWDDTIRTACTDGLSIWYNPTFFMSLTPDEQVFLLLHEVNHVALLHTIRAESFQKKKYNYAADYVINVMLVDQGYKMPKGGLLDTQYRGMNTEQVYKLIPDPPPDWEMDIRLCPKSKEEVRQLVDQILVKAGMEAQAAGLDPGKLPGEIQFYIDSLVNPKLPWYQILRKLTSKLVKKDYNFNRPNRRFMPDFYMPTRKSDSIDNFAVITDSSGSVSDKEFSCYVGHTMNVLKQMQPDKISFVQFDTDIKSVEVVRCAEDFKRIKFVGRGGTDIKPALDWITENKPTAAIIFTDGGFSEEPYLGKTPIIWIIVNNPRWTSKFGKVIHYTYKE